MQLDVMQQCLVWYVKYSEKVGLYTWNPVSIISATLALWVYGWSVYLYFNLDWNMSRTGGAPIK